VFGQQGVKAEGEGDDEQGADDGELEEGLHHVGEHDNIDAEKRKLTDVGKLEQRGNLVLWMHKYFCINIQRERTTEIECRHSKLHFVPYSPIYFYNL
jgi:hypothetical protein